VRNTIFSGAVLVVALSAASTMQAAFVQMLNNRSFENTTNHSQSWTIASNIAVVENYATMNHSPGLPPGSPGTWGLHNVSNTGQNQGNATQVVTLAPGVYKFNASAWARVYDDGGTTESQARLRIDLDGVAIDNDLDSVNGPDNYDLNKASGGWTPWTQMQTMTYTRQVNTSLAVFFRGRSNGQGGDFWGQVAADLFRLDVELQTAPTVTNAEYAGIDASVPGTLTHQFQATDIETPAGPFAWDQLVLQSYTPNYGGAGSGPAVMPTLSGSGAFEWNTVGSPRGDYVFRVRASDNTNIDFTGADLSSTGTITVRITSVPEPTSFAVCGLVLMGVVVRLRRR
jgi:hypothetical protein